MKLASLVIAAAALITTAAHSAVTYRITDLGPGIASSINNVGQVLGSTAGDLPRADRPAAPPASTTPGR